jgi:acetolactate synthase-1/2/3 large subunit
MAIDRRDEHREADRLTPVTLSSILDDLLDPDDIVVEDAVTSRGAVLNQLDRTQPKSYYANGAAGLGWGGGAAIGVKLGHPEQRVVSLLGDGAYLFAHPSSTAAFGVTAGAPTLTVIYDNRGWNAVKSATERQHPEGVAARDGVPGSRFESSLDLSAPAGVVDAYTAIAHDREQTRDAIADGLEAVAGGRPAVVDVKLEPL